MQQLSPCLQHCLLLFRLDEYHLGPMQPPLLSSPLQRSHLCDPPGNMSFANSEDSQTNPTTLGWQLEKKSCLMVQHSVCQVSWLCYLLLWQQLWGNVDTKQVFVQCHLSCSWNNSRLRSWISFRYMVFVFGDFVAHFSTRYKQLTPCAGACSALTHWLRTNVIVHADCACTDPPVCVRCP